MESLVDTNHTLAKLKEKSSKYSMVQPIIRYDKLALDVGLEGDAVYGAEVTPSSNKTLKISTRCRGIEDSYVEVQLEIKDQIPINIMVKRMCGAAAVSHPTSLTAVSHPAPASTLDHHESRGLISSLFHMIIAIIITILRLALVMALVAGFAYMLDKLCFGRLIEHHLASVALPMNQKNTNDRKDLVELKPLMKMKQYGTLND